jgi:pimeloyl-ACP methyl ester carboxylesterase
MSCTQKFPGRVLLAIAYVARRRLFPMSLLALSLLGALSAMPRVQAGDTPAAAGVEGTWQGALKVGPFQAQVAFHLKKSAGGSITATLDAVGIKGRPCGKTEFTDGKIAIDVPDEEFKARFDGVLSSDGRTITGNWKQDGETRPLVLKRVEKVAEFRRPQTPKKPYPYESIERTFENTVGPIALSGTLTLPKGKGPFPAALLLSGSGPNDRDETLLGHQPFLVLADSLTRAGFATLRFDKRGVNKSGGKFEGATPLDFASDALAAVRYLKGCKEIDSRRIGIIGHSEGGLIAPMIAADHPDDIAFLVLLAAPGLVGHEMTLIQFDDFVSANKMTGEAVDLSRKFLNAMSGAALAPGATHASITTLHLSTTVEARKRLEAAASAFAGQLSEPERKLMGADKEGWAAAAVERFADPSMRFILAYDPQPVLYRVRCPVLAHTGAKDIQVQAKKNLPLIAAALARGGNRAVTTKEIDRLNHQFQTCSTGLPSEYGEIEETFAPVALTVISDWLGTLKK